MQQAEWEDTVLSLLMRVTHAYFQKNFQQLNSIGLHPGQPPMLWHIFKDEGLSQKELASRLKVKPPTVNVSLQRMERADYICRRQDERDQRVSHIYLTEKGRRLAERIGGIMKGNNSRMTQGFTEAEVCLLTRFLKQMVVNIESIQVDGAIEKGEM